MTLHTFGWMNKLLGATLLAALSSGCAGGSGSSGFDAKFAESAAIMRALAERRCVTPETQKPVYCPADVAVPAGGPGTINVGLDQTNLPCSASGGTQCTVGLPFMPEGLPTSASYRTAIRTVDPIG
ncbi:MAG: hypothetical protein HY270_16130, partial [Deltaproteobacteria bacterium]|nr:hypothetical protein [Deltaproteobacteria bacterium]